MSTKTVTSWFESQHVAAHDSIMIQLGQGTGKFDHLVAYEGNFLVADLNNDGFVDLVPKWLPGS